MRQLVKLFLFLPLFIFANESMGSDKIKSLNKKEQLEDFILILNTKVGKNEAKTANDILQEVLKTRK
ncbi:hypothetical protein [Arcobacter sp. F2176]|uniref:hypothetical protein n=1 Tax=Arcobacter sp. F2176 TaxID=2044511 RepID=UPI00100A559A|nr:hypothetical protein [Arcobacter sp. F2176]RXJ81029.1 hypothetical protein CRU95_08910 [Arcobacter sp. F2176]